MKNIFLFFLLIQLCHCSSVETKVDNNIINVGTVRSFSVTDTQNIEVIKSGFNDSLELQIVITEKDWLEYLQLVKKVGDSIQWTKKEEFDSLGLSIEQARFIRLSGFQWPMIEIYTIS
ncbi:MAG: hypothetical protein M3R17_13185, partial [Bacteroidota bacterium]|nr:hypothetical protein [Bacteroidota bacterium]